MSESETLREITTAVLTELASAEAKYSWKNYSIEKVALVLMEEAGEVAQAVNNLDEKNGTIEQVRTELIQTAAMCYKILKWLDKEEEPQLFTFSCRYCLVQNHNSNGGCSNCGKNIFLDV